MTYKKVSSAIRKLADDLISNKELSQNIIIKKGKAFHVFGQYVIIPRSDSWVVISDMFVDCDLLFSSSKTALAWCILTKSNYHALAAEVKYIDSMLAYKQASIELFIEQINNSNQSEQFKVTLQARLTEDIFQRQIYKKQLLKCINFAKYIKLKGTS